MSNEINEKKIALLNRWLMNAKRSQIANYHAANHFSKTNYSLGIPAVILSAVVGTCVFAGIGKQVPMLIQIGVGLISILASVLGALQTFLGLEQRSSKHRITASEYGAIKREIDHLLSSH